MGTARVLPKMVGHTVGTNVEQANQAKSSYRNLLPFSFEIVFGQYFGHTLGSILAAHSIFSGVHVGQHFGQHFGQRFGHLGHNFWAYILGSISGQKLGRTFWAIFFGPFLSGNMLATLS